jgi:hypothetical protein
MFLSNENKTKNVLPLLCKSAYKQNHIKKLPDKTEKQSIESFKNPETRNIFSFENNQPLQLQVSNFWTELPLSF